MVAPIGEATRLQYDKAEPQGEVEEIATKDLKCQRSPNIRFMVNKRFQYAYAAYALSRENMIDGPVLRPHDGRIESTPKLRASKIRLDIS